MQSGDQPVRAANQDKSSAVVALHGLSLMEAGLALGTHNESDVADDPGGDVRGERERGEHGVVAVTRHETVTWWNVTAR